MIAPPAQHAQPVRSPVVGEFFNQANPVEARLSALADAGDWDALCDQFEALPIETALRFRGTWVEALGRARRWERLQRLCDRLLKAPAYLKDPRRPDFLRQRARALSQLLRHAEALAAWEELGRGGDLLGRVNACQEAELQQDWPALGRNALALSKMPGLKPALVGEAATWRGEALARQNRFAEAEPAFKAALAVDPNQALTWANLGRCLNERRAWPEAREAFDHALALQPGLLEALYNRGLTLFNLKRYAESRDDFRAALAQRPGDPVLKENLRQAERFAALDPH